MFQLLETQTNLFSCVCEMMGGQQIEEWVSPTKVGRERERERERERGRYLLDKETEKEDGDVQLILIILQNQHLLIKSSKNVSSFPGKEGQGKKVVDFFPVFVTIWRTKFWVSRIFFFKSQQGIDIVKTFFEVTKATL